MADLVTALELWKLVVGVLLMTITGLSGLILWFGKRIRSVSTAVAAEAIAPHAETIGRVAGVERGLGEVAARVRELKDDHGTIVQRMSRLETTMESLARRDDVTKVVHEFVEFRGTTTAEVRRMAGMVDTMYRALLRADEKK